MKNLTKTFVFTFVLCLVVVGVASYVQITGQVSAGEGCSYLDPILIDILAFLVAVFLVIEGIARILEHPNASLKRQFTRVVRIAIGCAIITIHILQFVHK